MYVLFQVVQSSELALLLNISFIREIFMFLLIVVSTLFVIPIVFKKNIFFYLIFIFLVLFTNAIITRQFILLLNFLVIVALSNMVSKVDLILYANAAALIIGICIVLLLFWLGVIPARSIIQNDRLRHFLGFNLPVILPNLYATFVTYYAFIKKEDINIVVLILLAVPSFIIMNFTDGRQNFFTLILMIGLLVVSKCLKKEKIVNILYYSNLLLFFGGIFVSIFAAAFYYSLPFLREWDFFFTGRFSWFALAWENFPIRLLGNNVAGHMVRINIDNLYLQLLLRGGVIIFAIFIYVMITLLKHYKENKDNTALVISIIMFIASLVSPGWMPIWRNVLLFTLPGILSERNSIKEAKQMESINLSSIKDVPPLGINLIKNQ